MTTPEMHAPNAREPRRTGRRQHRHVAPRRPGTWTATFLVAAPVAFATLVTPAFAAPTEPGEGAANTATTPVTTTVAPAVPSTAVPASTQPTTTPPTPTTPTSTGVTPTTTPATTPATTPTTTPTTTPATAPTTTAPPAAPPAPAPRHVRVGKDALPYILATIRYLESRGNYTAPPNKGNASGAYQFIAKTWGNYGGYPHAYLAPPAVQDERATADVLKFLDQWNYDVSMIPVMWYLPSAARNPWLMDVVPMPWNSNVLTIREYQTRWLGIFSFMSGQPLPAVAPPVPVLTEEERRARAGLPPVVPARDDGGVAIAYPVLGPSRVAVPECDTAEQPAEGPDPSLFIEAGLCSEEAPGVVFGVKLQPVLSVTDGVVTAVRDDPGSADPISVVVTDVTGRSFTHSGFNDDSPGTDDGAAPDHLRLTALARVGATVRAGQVLGFMGNSDPLPLGVRAEVPTDATVSIDPDTAAPHVRISITELDGTPVDAFGPLVDALFRQNCTVATGPWAMPPNGSGRRPTTIETTDNDRTIDSEWVIGEDGVVTATGWAAMVNPHDGCPYAPAEPHGPGAGGSNEVPWSWLVPIDLPTSVWVRLAADEADRATAALLRRA